MADFLSSRGATLVGQDGEVVATSDSLKGKVCVFYFAASWCPDCVAFTPTLNSFYSQVKQSGIEIVFVSSDQNEQKRRAHMEESHGPWLSLKYVFACCPV